MRGWRGQAPQVTSHVQLVKHQGEGNRIEGERSSQGMNKGLDTLSEDMPTVVIACRVLQGMLEQLLPEDPTVDVTFQDYGLHRVPSKMTKTLQEAIDDIEKPSLVVLGYGLCGNGLNEIRSRDHVLLVPRADDCIALLLGSREAYLREFDAEPGTYYLSKGWLEAGSHPLSEYEEYAEKYGPDQAEWIMDEQYRNYRRLALVTHNQADLEKYRPLARQVAAFCERWDMRYEEIVGSDDYVRSLVETIERLRANNLAAANVEDDFLVIPPGSQIRQGAFIGYD